MLKDEPLEAQSGSMENGIRCHGAAPKVMGKGEILTVAWRVLKSWPDRDQCQEVMVKHFSHFAQARIHSEVLAPKMSEG